MTELNDAKDTLMNHRTPIDDLLIGGLDDWVYASWATNSVRHLVSGPNVRTLTIGLITEAVVEGLMLPGDVDSEGHHPWPCSAGEAIERIAREWLTEWADELPTPGAIVWLANTEAGNQIARRVLQQEAARGF